ncbi:DUF3060 domain-containing protein [Mycobacterium sp. CBMA293]|uniref:DUF3060 domain-containing protein n=1 Tax=unclassified Mycolicibacterium TaxID=2636767 RepID=UPI0012DDD6C0|nr:MULTISPECIES: DUF3060 domain-containing protein [unclassified Mycolicibacterium]MUL45755.1 DUF3060 domain-containing protein [Mycolicibacterium sp. CBMA 360]MUL60426.1 DUF3060 domain-containing protein [Mycolicibacterium sp. CBMA 335]MUL72241.1 DUF3060 domain-containing protein [Mycolicibacterium sp. CBMA 311]MUL95358.1 DUF3060 domain-containing protein [Mycolicibacterium sp. CBMA 230]MUM06821.1 hypothetical protein [Mycolicibacterium sp. CBMA 213]
MSRDDDPEVRIRELERAMNERARASELTEPGHQWASATPALDQTYSDRYRRIQPPPSGSGTSVRRVIYAAFLLAGLAAPVIAAVIFVGNFATKKHPTLAPPSAGRPPSVSVAAPTQSSQSSQSVVVNGTTVMSGPGLIELPPQSGDASQPIQIAGVRGSRTLACNDRPVNISGVSNSVTITGHCLTVEVSGIENTVIVDSADKIVTSGMDNHVTYHSGEPEIPAPGGSNTVSRG